MSETPQPFLAYTRIEANRRKTRLLLASFALVLLPVLSAGAVWLMPWVTLIGGAIGYAVFGQKLIAILDSWQREIAAKLPAEGTLGTLDLPAPVLLIEGGLLLVALVMTVMALVGLTSFLIARYGSRAVLRQASARPVGREQEPDLVRIVENLCIGTGLPLPSIYLVESPAPNAFATGNDPQHATLVVTRGLLTLLNRRELEGVIGHELSHIGNHDIRLNTVLAALVGTMTLPFRMCEALFRPAFRLHWTVGACATWMAVTLCLSFAHLFAGFAHMAEGEFSARIHPFLWWWTLHSLTAPVHAVFVAPVLALLIRRAVSRQREFLADSDATLLTRDPEGLLLALVKIGAAGGERLEVGEGSVHLCIVDPHPPNRGSVSIASLLHRLFPSHPPLKERIELLARMGSGIAPAALEAALEAGAKARGTRPEPVDAPAAEPDLQPDAVPSFTDVETRAGTYVPPATAVAISPDPAGGPTLTPLYERPDGWSRVLARLPHDAPVTAIASEGHFVQVSTRENLLGYVARSAPLAALSALERTADAGSWKS